MPSPTADILSSETIDGVALSTSDSSTGRCADATLAMGAMLEAVWQRPACGVFQPTVLWGFPSVGILIQL